MFKKSQNKTWNARYRYLHIKIKWNIYMIHSRSYSFLFTLIIAFIAIFDY